MTVYIFCVLIGPLYISSKLILFIYLGHLGPCCCTRLYLVAAPRLTVAVASLAADLGLQHLWASEAAARGLSSCISQALEHRQQFWRSGGCCSMAGRIFLDQEPSACCLHWQVESLALSHQGSPICMSYLGDCLFKFFAHLKFVSSVFLL